MKKTARGTGRKRRGGRGPLVAVAALLMVSAAIRFGEGVGQALARIPEPESPAEPAGVEPGCETPEDLRGLLNAFRARETRLTTREAAMEERMQALRVSEETINQRIEQLKQAETALRETIAMADSAAEDDLSRLTKIYENMKPQKAAALFEEMDPIFAAGFLGRMRPEAAAGIMAGLSPEAAQAFSVVIAGRNAEVPRE